MTDLPIPSETSTPEPPATEPTGLGSEPAASGTSFAATETETPTSSAPEALLELALSELRTRRDRLAEEIAALEQRRDQIQRQIAGSFSGQSDAIARRVKGFQEYLVGALQDLAAAADQMELTAAAATVRPSPLDQQPPTPAPAQSPPAVPAGPFGQDEELIREQLMRFQGQPDFHADPWKLRRTLEPAGAALLEEWFLGQAGRGAQPSAGSRNRNILVAAAAIAILGELFGDRFQALVLASRPERLGEWRRGLQDCLGLSREDFGPASGIVLFERPDALIERADRLEERGELPVILIDAGEQVVEIPILQFPLWLAFAAAPGELDREEELY